MKIIRCQIEAFGCLKNRLFDFTEDGLNVFQEDNGFGKTTLTVFIKSMFYGLCGNGRTINGNERKKYKPWNSTSFGGYLIFEQSNSQYRITRKFGNTKASDETTIVDEKTGRKTEKFGKQINGDEIGTVLFGLDASSFAKTIFLSQEDMGVSFNPNQINGRLMKLVESGDDFGDYDMAKKGLDEALKQYKSGRGKSKSDRIQEKISENQLLLQDKMQDKVLLEDKQEKLKIKIEAKEEITSKIDKIKSLHISAVQAQTKKTEYDTFVDKQESIANKLKQTQDLEDRYGGKIPALDEIDDATNLVIQIKEAKIYAEEDAAIRKAKRNIEDINAQFSGVVPSLEEIEEIRKKASRKEKIETEINACYVEELEEKRAEELNKTFDGEKWNKETFDKLRELNSERTKLIGQLESEEAGARVYETEESYLFLESSIPEEKEINSINKAIENIQRCTNSIAEYAQQITKGEKVEKADKTKTIAAMVLIAVGVTLLITGAVLYFLNFDLKISVAAAIAGIVLFLSGVILKIKRNPDKEEDTLQTNTNPSSISALAKEKEECEKNVAAFLSRYGYEDSNYAANLFDLKQRIQTLNRYNEYQESLSRKTKQLREKISLLDKQMEQYFKIEIIEKEDLSSEISVLEKDFLEHIKLNERILHYKELEKETQEEYQACSLTIKQFLSRLNVIDETKGEREPLNEIQKLIQRYDEAKEIINAWEEENKNKRADNATAINAVDAFASQYIKFGMGLQEGLVQLREDAVRYFELLDQIKEEQANLETFKENHAGVESFDITKYMAEDTDKLTVRLEELEAILGNISDEIFEMQKEINNLDLSVQEIPSIEDEINDLFEDKKSTEEQCEIIESTIRILQEAKENLANKYLAPVSSAFNEYCKLVLDKEDYVRIDEGLNVTVDEYGAFREQDSLSEGTGDLISVCMRLALADALFEKETMPIILDDPFTNLDDNRLQKTLDMIKKVAEGKQVIYLTCHSSRVPD